MGTIAKPNKSKSSGGWSRAQIGTSSLVLIFTVLALVIFSTLSLSSARTDQRLAEKNAAYVEAYYRADGMGEELLRDVNRQLEEAEIFSGTDAAYLERIRFLFGDRADAGQRLLTYGIPMGEEQTLLIQLRLLPLAEARQTSKNYEIRAWRVQNVQEYQVDDRLPVWDGEAIE